MYLIQIFLPLRDNRGKRIDQCHFNNLASELSERFGFPEPAHFTRFFRDHAGVSPREFRNVSRLAG